MDSISGYHLMVVAAPIVLLLVIVFAMMRNRQKGDARDVARTEAATRELYEREDAGTKAREAEVRR